jgi:hypothetical protein
MPLTAFLQMFAFFQRVTANLIAAGTITQEQVDQAAAG